MNLLVNDLERRFARTYICTHKCPRLESINVLIFHESPLFVARSATATTDCVNFFARLCTMYIADEDSLASLNVHADKALIVYIYYSLQFSSWSTQDV